MEELQNALKMRKRFMSHPRAFVLIPTGWTLYKSKQRKRSRTFSGKEAYVTRCFCRQSALALCCGLAVSLFLCWNYASSQPPNRFLRPQSPPAKQPAKAQKNQVSPDFARLSFFEKQLWLGARRGTAWLVRANRSDGRFLYGLDPAVRVPSTKDNFVHQAAAAFALARAGRYFHDEKATAVARQTLLTLLLETEKDSKQPKLRRPVLMTSGGDQLAAAGWLVMAIHELPSPGADLVAKAGELCNFIRSQQGPDGSFRCPGTESSRSEKNGPAVTKHDTGAALYALAYSYRHDKTTWKIDALRKALSCYRSSWRKEKNTDMIPWHSAAYTEAFMVTKEPAFADFVLEMNDWLCTLQYKQLDPRQSNWAGGFQKWHDGQSLPVAPDIHSARYLEGLAHACEVARYRGDLKRFRTYRSAMESCGQFVFRLQFSSSNTQHFADWYRQEIIGAFHLHHENGQLRIDYTQEAVCGLIQYLKGSSPVR